MNRILAATGDAGGRDRGHGRSPCTPSISRGTRRAGSPYGAAGFTNLSQDHLGCLSSMASDFAAKVSGLTL